MTITIPARLKIGYVERKDTYTGQLAYVIYYDSKGVLRQEASWENWRNKSIEPTEYLNVPMEGFVLNKKTGDYRTDWGHRLAHIRVYDPRGFEFEISVDNLLWILENSNSIKGKGLEGRFVYGWEGKNVILVPVDSPDYKDIKEFSDKVGGKRTVTKKTIVPGATYIFKSRRHYVYMGCFDYYDYEGKNMGPCFFFRDDSGSFVTYKSLSPVIEVHDLNVDENYPAYMDELQSRSIFSPIDLEKTQYPVIEKDLFMAWFPSDRASYQHTLVENCGRIIEVRLSHDPVHNEYPKVSISIRSYYFERNSQEMKFLKEYSDKYTPEELYDLIKPRKEVSYLENGRAYAGRQ